MGKRLTFIIVMICTSIIGYSQTPSFDILVGTEKVTKGCVGVTLTLKNTSADTTRLFNWNIDGFNIKTTSTIFVFLKDGNYPITLTDEQSTLSTTQTIVINPLPNASFSVSTNTICIGNAITFSSSSTGTASILTYYWKFEDEALVTYNKQVSYTFNKVGSKKVLLFVKDSNGCLSPTSSATTITVNGPGNTTFKTENNLFYSCDNSITFENTSQNTGSFTWDFGDGETSSDQSTTTHTYAKYGEYTVQLSQNEDKDSYCASEFTHEVYIGKPSILINAVDSICSGTSFKISATDTSNNFDLEANDILWESNEGTFLADSTALSYQTSGSFKLTAVNKIGCPATTSKTITVLQTPTLQLSISPSGTICKLVPITLTAETDNDAIITWNLGDGSTRSTQNQDTIIHSYDKTGTYSIYAQASNSSGCSSVSTTATINLTDNCVDNGTDSILNPVFEFTSDCDNKYLVTFKIRNTTKSPESITIDGVVYPFNDSTVTIQLSKKIKGQTYNVLVKFKDGTYDVAREITIMDETADFSIVNNDNDKKYCSQNNFTFSSSDFVNNANISDFSWTIEDIDGDSILFNDSGSDLNSINYYMPYPSDFKITLTIKDKRTPACISSISKTIKVTGAIGKFYSMSDSIFCKPSASIIIKNGSILDKDKFNYMIWDFGDGTTKQYDNLIDTIQHQYTYTGSNSSVTYNVSLKITDNDGCTSNITAYNKYKLYNAKLSITPEDSIYCNSKTIKINNTSTIADLVSNGFEWSFNNITKSLGLGEVFEASTTGISFPSVYSIYVAATYGDGITCHIDSTFADLIKFIKPKASFVILDSNQLAICPPYILHINNTSSGYKTLQWTLSDSIINTSFKDTILYYIERPSNYSIKLKVNGYDNCYDSISYAFVSIGPIATLSNTTYKLCTYVSTTLKVSSNDPIENYLWSYGDGTTLSDPTASTVTHQYENSGTYKPSVTIIGSVESGHCFNKLELDTPIQIDERINLQYQENYSYCLGDTVFDGLKLEVSSNATPYYSWISDPISTIAGDTHQNYFYVKPTESTTYHVYAKSNNTCPDDSATIWVTTHESPIVKFPNKEITIPAGTIFTSNPTVVSTYGNLKYYWTPTTRIDNPNIENPQIISDNNTIYHLVAENEFGCTGEDSFYVKTLCASSKIMIPSAFTPNNDGKNDLFYVMGYGIKLVNHFIVVDRWGKIVFERNNIDANDTNNAWDGYIGKVPAAMGTYVYFANITCSEGNILPLKGTVVLIR